MKIGFSKDGLKLNQKDFNPLNIPLPIKGIGIESDIPAKQPDAAEILSVFQRPNIRKANRLQGIEILKSMLEKVR
ncbi:MAG: hypothetical protein GXY88_09875 [Tissierellia bacterium]|nr:hypothetical protein [Tissierellia bacterium]